MGRVTRESKTRGILSKSSVEPPTAVGAERGEQLFVGERNGQADFFVDVLARCKGGGRGEHHNKRG